MPGNPFERPISRPPLPKYPLNERGYHTLLGPSCQSDQIETRCMSVTPEHDPNTKRCAECGYTWRQETP